MGGDNHVGICSPEKANQPLEEKRFKASKEKPRAPLAFGEMIESMPNEGCTVHQRAIEPTDAVEGRG